MTLLCWINISDDDFFTRDTEETFFSLSQSVLRRWTVSVINFEPIRFNNSVLHGDKGLGLIKAEEKAWTSEMQAHNSGRPRAHECVQSLHVR